MKIEDILNDIWRGPKELVLDQTLQVNHSIGFSEFLCALSRSKSIHRVDYHGILDTYLSFPEKEQVVEAIGQIKGIEELSFSYGVSVSLKALATALRTAKKLRILNIGIGSRLTAANGQQDVMDLAVALQYHPSIEAFTWILRQHFDQAIAKALSTCPNLKHISLTEYGNFSISDGIQELAKSDSVTSMELRTACSWTTIAELLREKQDENTQHIQLKHFHITHFPYRPHQHLSFEDFKAFTDEIEKNKSLETLQIGIKGGFSDNMGVTLANALGKNRGKLTEVKLLAATFKPSGALTPQINRQLGESAYNAFFDALYENPKLVLTIDVAPQADKESEVIADARSKMGMMPKLNSLGRAKLIDGNASTMDWVNTFSQINHDFAVSPIENADGMTMALSCIYSLLRMNPVPVLF